MLQKLQLKFTNAILKMITSFSRKNKYRMQTGCHSHNSTFYIKLLTNYFQRDLKNNVIIKQTLQHKFLAKKLLLFSKQNSSQIHSFQMLHRKHRLSAITRHSRLVPQETQAECKAITSNFRLVPQEYISCLLLISRKV